MQPWDNEPGNPKIVDLHAAACAQIAWRSAATHTGEERANLLIEAQRFGLRARGFGTS